MNLSLMKSWQIDKITNMHQQGLINTSGDFMKERIKQLEELARSLEPNAEARAILRDQVMQHADKFLEQLPHAPAYLAPNNDLTADDLSISEDPIDMTAALELLKQKVDHSGVTMSSGYLAFIPGSGMYASALADYLAAITNRYVGAYFASPGGVNIERKLLRWMADFIGYPASAAGDITSGGSIANLVGIVTARDAHDLKAKDFSRSVVYLSEQTHHSIDKALRIAGLKECIRRYIPLDEHYRMRPEALETAIKNDKKSGLNPWMIIASAGTTDTGAVDPLIPISDLAQTHHIWLHVDGAYGVPFALCDPGKKILQGIERSDSIILDGHKGLFLPFGSGTVLVKNGQHLLQSHYYSANYLQDMETLASSDEISPSELSPELSRPFRGLRLWLPLKLAGVAPFRAALEEKLLLARYFYEEIQQLDGFTVGPYPDLSIVTFRYLPERGDANEFNRKLISAVQQDGRIFLSSTMLDGKFTLRLAVLGLRTHQETIDLALEVLQEKAKTIIEAGEQ